jgi:hypothetical protein
MTDWMRLPVTFSFLPAWVTFRTPWGVIHEHRRKGEMVRYRRCKRHGIA